MSLFANDAPDWKALYEAEREDRLREREENVRLTKVIEKMRRQGFNAGPEKAVVVVPKTPDQHAVEREEETVIGPIVEALRRERPDLSDAQLTTEARRLVQAASGGL